MDKHTLGSWHIGVNSPDAVFSADGDFICNLGAHADANLIAAAPDLLAFVESITDPLGPYPDLDGHSIVADAYKAIAKARGE